MHVRKQENLILISFHYDPLVVSFVKSLEGRKYLPHLKEWSIPLVGSHASIDRLAKRGFSISPDLWAEVRKDQEQAREAEALALLPDIEFETNLPLYNYQRVVSAFMVKTGSCLNACGVRTGKTVMTLATTKKNGTKKNLVIVPGSILYQWEEECKRFLPEYETFVVIGNIKQRRIVYEAVKKCDKPFFLILSYDIARVDKDLIMDMIFQNIICDESHRLANPSTQRYKAIQKISQGSKHRYALTATPLMNRPPDLWGILNWVNPGAMGARQTFLDHYTVRNQWGGMLYPINLQELSQKIKRHLIRKTLEEVAPELPAVTIEDIFFDLSEKETKLYSDIKKELLFQIENHLIENLEHPMVIQQTLVKMLILIELTCSLELLGKDTTSTKLEILKEKLEDIFVDPDIKVVIFSRFKKMIHIFERELKEYNPLVISGDVNNKERDVVRKTFQNDDSRRLLVSTDAGGEGLTLNRGDVVFHYDLPYSYGKYEQRNGRIKALDKQRPIMIYNLVARKSMDVWLSKMINNKSKLSSTLLGDTPISMEQIQEMLKYE